MKNEMELLEGVEQLFSRHVGKGRALSYEDLRIAAGFESTASLYRYSEGKDNGALIAAAHLCRACPEAMQMFANLCGYAAEPVTAQQGHDDADEVAGWCAGFVHRHFKRKSDGKFCHRDLAETINDLRRGMKRIGLFLVAPRGKARA